MEDVKISYNARTGRYIIKSPPWMVSKMRDIPNRRWDGTHKVWTAPAIRANSKYLKEAFGSECFTPEALSVLDVSIEKVVPARSDFPAYYKFKTEPFNHQREALNKIYGQKHLALFMEMRTGKTKTLIDYVSAHHMEGEIDTVVVVCPYSVRKNWEIEIATHCPHAYICHILDTSKPKKFSAWMSESEKCNLKWLIVGVESLAAGNAKNYVEHFLLASVKAMMVVDESHKIKTHSANRSKECVRLGKMAERRAILTGTAVANGPMDIYMQFEFLDPNIIGVGDFYSFRNRYAIMGGFEDRQVVGYQNMDELMEIISPFVYQVARKDVFDLPPKIRTVRRVKMSADQAKLYHSMAKNKFVNTSKGVLSVQTMLEKMLRLQEISGGVVAVETPNGPTKFTHHRISDKPAKVAEMMSVLEEITGSVIVWCAYKEEIRMVTEALREVYGTDQVVEIHGDISHEDRHHNVYNLFQNKSARFLVGNATTGGVGLKMSAAETVIYYSNTFSYTDRVQSEDRTQSADQTKSVLYIDLVCEGTVDEIIIEALDGKQDVSDYVKNSINTINRRLDLAV